MAREIRLGEARVAVTGAGGFIGAAVCRRLLAEGAAVTAIDLEGPALARLEGTGATMAPADVTDAKAMRGALAGASALVHCAAIVSDAGTMRDHVEVNVRGTAVTLAAATEAGVERALHVSSVVVFGYESPDVLDETAHPRVTGVPYIDTKTASDRLARRRGAVVVRPGDVYGPGSVPWTIRPAGLARAGLLAVVGDGGGAMLAVYIDDLVEGVALAITRGRPGEAYTIFNDTDPVSFARYFDALGALAGTRARRVPAPLLRGAGLVAELGGRLTGSPPALTRHAVVMLRREGGATAAKAREELGWAPEVDLEEGMRRTGEWLNAEGLL